MTVDLERVRFYLALSREFRGVSGEYDGIRLLWLDQAAAQLRFNPYHDPKNGRFTSGSRGGVDVSGENDIIKENSQGSVKIELHNLGTIDIDKYKNITDKKILSNEVIITDNRIEHIIQRRGQIFYDEYQKYFGQIVKDPDYIFKDIKENTAIVSKSFLHKGKTINLVLRLAVEGDDIAFKNSIITAIAENDKRFAQRLRNNNPIYKKVDINE